MVTTAPDRTNTESLFRATAETLGVQTYAAPKIRQPGVKTPGADNEDASARDERENNIEGESAWAQLKRKSHMYQASAARSDMDGLNGENSEKAESDRILHALEESTLTASPLSKLLKGATRALNKLTQGIQEYTHGVLEKCREIRDTVVENARAFGHTVMEGVRGATHAVLQTGRNIGHSVMETIRHPREAAHAALEKGREIGHNVMEFGRHPIASVKGWFGGHDKPEVQQAAAAAKPHAAAPAAAHHDKPAEHVALSGQKHDVKVGFSLSSAFDHAREGLSDVAENLHLKPHAAPSVAQGLHR